MKPSIAFLLGIVTGWGMTIVTQWMKPANGEKYPNAIMIFALLILSAGAIAALLFSRC